MKFDWEYRKDGKVRLYLVMFSYVLLIILLILSAPFGFSLLVLRATLGREGWKPFREWFRIVKRCVSVIGDGTRKDIDKFNEDVWTQD